MDCVPDGLSHELVEVEARLVQVFQPLGVTHRFEPYPQSRVKSGVNPSGAPGFEQFLKTFVPEAPDHVEM